MHHINANGATLHDVILSDTYFSFFHVVPVSTLGLWWLVYDFWLIKFYWTNHELDHSIWIQIIVNGNSYHKSQNWSFVKVVFVLETVL